VTIVVAAVLALGSWLGQEPAPAPAVTLEITSPADGSYISGPVRLQAVVRPIEAVGRIRSVAFQVDGMLVCTIARPPFACDWDAGPMVEEHLIRAVATLAEGGRVVATARTKRIDHAEMVDVTAVQVTVTVTDGRGRFVSGLRRDQFKVFEDDVPQRIESFAAENVPLELVAAIDISGSMRTSVPTLKDAVKEFLASVPSRDNVTLFGFNDNIFPLTRRSKDPAARLAAVDRLAAWGGTALYDVIIRGLETLDRLTGRKALVVFTDGEDQGSHATRDATVRKLEESDATMYMIGQGERAEAADLRDLMMRLARLSGGRAFFPARIEELRDVFQMVIEDLSNQYLLSYVPTNAERDGTWRAIRIELSDSSLRIRAREGYRAKSQ